MSFCISKSILFNANLDGQSVIQTRAQDLLTAWVYQSVFPTVTSSPELSVADCPKVCVSYSLERGAGRWPRLLQASQLGWAQAVGRMRPRLAPRHVPLILGLRLREQHVWGLLSWWTPGRRRAGGHPGCSSTVSPIWQAPSPTGQSRTSQEGGEVCSTYREGQAGWEKTVAVPGTKRQSSTHMERKERGGWGSTG